MLTVLDILISQTVDQGIQHGDDRHVKHRGQFDCVPGGCGVGHGVEEEDGSGKMLMAVRWEAQVEKVLQ